MSLFLFLYFPKDLNKWKKRDFSHLVLLFPLIDTFSFVYALLLYSSLFTEDKSYNLALDYYSPEQRMRRKREARVLSHEKHKELEAAAELLIWFLLTTLGIAQRLGRGKESRSVIGPVDVINEMVTI